MKILSKKDISEFYAKCEREEVAADCCSDLHEGKVVIGNLDESLNELQDEVA